MTAKIAVYGFGSSPVVFRHLIDFAKERSLGLQWCCILSLPNYRRIMADVLPPSEILDVFAALPYQPQGGDVAELSHYPGSLAEDLAAQKRQWRRRNGTWLQGRGQDYRNMFRSFLIDRGATHVLALTVESPEGKILIAVARELGLGVMFANDLRCLTGTMFAADAVETPPAYVRATPRTRAKAAELIAAFRQKWMPARSDPFDIDPASDDRTLLETFVPPFRKRMVQFARSWRERPDLFDPVFLRNAVMGSSPFLQNVVWGARERINDRMFHVEHESELPKRFIFYPLQFTPEASINTPAPYFVDQFRAVDALRFAMPSDMTLVVKEHRACIGLRPVSYMRRLMSLPGVLVAKSRMPSRTLVEKSGLTASITGTATFEAFLAGRSAMALGPGLSAWCLGGMTRMGDLREQIVSHFDNPLPQEQVIERVAMLLDGRYSFFHGSAHIPGEPMVRRGNITRFLDALCDHLKREKDTTQQAVPLATSLVG